MRHSVLATAISAIAILWSGVVYAAVATDSDRDWDWCNGTVDGGTSNDAQIAGCSARIQSGEETGANLFVAYYNRGGDKSAYLDPAMGPLELSHEDVKNLVAFLKALSGTPAADATRSQ